MSKMKKLILGLGALLALLALFITKYEVPGPLFGSAVSGVEATMATSSTISVSETVPTSIFSTSLGCSSRVISTAARPIRFSIGSTTPTQNGTIGFYQAASSTVNYDAGVWGCGNWQALSIGAAGVINTEEFR